MTISFAELTQDGAKLIRIPVPPVRPILRRTVKRFLRLLPSALLLLFVVSLIFVTLMQIAVIHSHRRALTFQATANNLSNEIQPSLSASSHSISQMKSGNLSSKLNELKNVQVKKQEVLRIEALLDRSSPSYASNMKLLQSFVNSARIREIIKFAQHWKPKLIVRTMFTQGDLAFSSSSPPSILLHEHHSQITDSANGSNEFLIASRGVEGNELSKGDAGKGTSEATDDEELRMRNTRNLQTGSSQESSAVKKADGQLVAKLTAVTTVAHSYLVAFPKDFLSPANKSPCPAVPPKLIGRIRVETRPNKSLSDIEAENPSVQDGGQWSPKHCTAHHKVAIIIPYRDRLEHLETLLYHLHPILQRQQLDYRVFVVEQGGNDTFNKGVLMNAGVREALKESNFQCFVFHDVDLIPEDDRNLYSCPFAPRHMSVAVDKFNYTLPYSYLVGGVFAISKSHYVLVNGYSNLYWAWGGEDDDMAHRLKYHNLHIIRPPESLARYTMIKHNHRAESPYNVRSALLRMAKRRATRDGLNSVKYQVVNKDLEALFTKVSIEIGHIHKWHFPTPNKLVLHF